MPERRWANIEFEGLAAMYRGLLTEPVSERREQRIRDHRPLDLLPEEGQAHGSRHLGRLVVIIIITIIIIMTG